MALRVIGYEGRRPIYVDEGPASARLMGAIGEGKASLIAGMPDRELGVAAPVITAPIRIQRPRVQAEVHHVPKEEPIVAIEPKPALELKSVERDTEEPVALDERATALWAIRDAADDAAETYSLFLEAKARWEQAQHALVAAWTAARETVEPGAALTETLHREIAQVTHSRVTLDEAARITEHLMTRSSDALEPVDDAPEVVTRRAKTPVDDVGQAGRTAAETRRSAAAPAGGSTFRPAYVTRMLEALVAAEGDFTKAATAAGIKRTSLVGSMSTLRKRTDLTDAERAVVARKRGG